MSTIENKAVVRRFFEAIATNTLDTLDEVLAPDFRTQGAEQTGAAGEKRSWQEAWAAIPDLRLDVHEMIAEGDKVVTRWTGRGTEHGRRSQVTGIHIHQVVDGKIVEAWAETSEGHQAGSEAPGETAQPHS